MQISFYTVYFNVKYKILENSFTLKNFRRIKKIFFLNLGIIHVVHVTQSVTINFYIKYFLNNVKYIKYLIRVRRIIRLRMLYLTEGCINRTVRKNKSKVQMGEQKCYKFVTIIYKFTILCVCTAIVAFDIFDLQKKY